MKFIDWFDINKKEHLQAYDHLSKTGTWPESFIPENVSMDDDLWQAVLSFRIANAYVGERLKRGHILQQDAKKYKEYLKSLTVDVNTCLEAIDKAMKKPDSHERGKRIAAICNAWEIQNDRARYFGLGINFRTDKKGLDHEPK